MPPPVHGVDPIKFEVIRNALVEMTEEMAIALRRSAYSTNIKTRADFSCAFFDGDLQLVAQSFSLPTHLGSLVELVPQGVRRYGAEQLGPGDAILTNHPYMGGAHLNDITLISPVFHDGRLFGYLANLAHHVDVGGGAPASVGAFREVFQWPRATPRPLRAPAPHRLPPAASTPWLPPRSPAAAPGPLALGRSPLAPRLPRPAQSLR
jgi:hypothetical protein